MIEPSSDIHTARTATVVVTIDGEEHTQVCELDHEDRVIYPRRESGTMGRVEVLSEAILAPDSDRPRNRKERRAAAARTRRSLGR